LHQAGGFQISDLAYQRGLKFLMDTQLKDGSWHVKSRSKPFQIYFESGFPHGKDQFISAAASSWATVALLQAYEAPKKENSASAQGPGAQGNLPAAQSYHPGDEFFQQLQVGQQSRFQIQGLNLQTQLQYSVLSRFTILKVMPGGGMEVKQKIEAVQFQADELSKPLVAQAAQKLQGAVFSITLNAAREVTQLQGVPENPVIAPQPLAGGQGFQMISLLDQDGSLLDQDGWKEMIEATFFVPPEPPHPKAQWAKKMTHSWGPLGQWAGQVFYTPTAKKDDLVRIDYLYQMKYFPPAAKPAGLPFDLAGANFQPVQARGSLLYDTTRGKVLAIEEVFQVKGALSIALLGAKTPVLLEEDQAFVVEILDQNPLKG
jgi:hypothetical protein